MNIGLIDVDGHGFPNLALMKISAYHKRRGDTVDWYSIFDHYDIVYMSKVFTHKPDYKQVITNADLIEKGGTGYSLTKQLPPEIDMEKDPPKTLQLYKRRLRAHESFWRGKEH